MPSTSSPAFTTTVVGIQGPPGNGAPGTTTRGGTGVPSNTLGIDGDFYLDSATGKLYLRASGAYSLFMTLVGLTGATGATGASTKWTVGSGAPVDSAGNDGDLYLVTVSGDVYQRASGHYSLIANIKGLTGATGAPGAAGTILRSGTAAPSNSSGIDGDFYLNTATGALFQRQAGVYTSAGNLQGPPGATGGTGARGATGTTGAAGAPGMILRNGSAAPVNTSGIDGDYYLVNTTGALYQRQSGAYASVGSMQGPQGTPGSILRSGTAAPSNGTGIDGDYYLNTASGALYQRQSGTYVSVGSLQGPTGPQGVAGAASNNGEIALTDAATIAADASSGTAFVITLSLATSQLGIPSNARPGNFYVYRIIQDATSGRASPSRDGNSRRRSRRCSAPRPAQSTSSRPTMTARR